MVTEDKLEELKSDLVKGAKKLYSKGLNEDNEGNISIRVNSESLLITPTANQYDTLTKDDIVHIDFEGNLLSSGKLPSTETKLHIALYNSRKKVNCVVHTHSSYASMLSILRKSIPIIMEEQVIYLGGSIDVAPYGEAHTEEVGELALKALGYKNGALLANHGVIVCGKSVIDTVKYAEFVEKLAKIYWGTLQIGNPYTLEDKDLTKFKHMFKSLFSNCSRKLLKDL
ncbi:MAG: class II aldolase/adducin family protein [Candidatus Lokiarchaeota archaeon]